MLRGAAFRLQISAHRCCTIPLPMTPLCCMLHAGLTLPLQLPELRRITVVGPLANQSELLLGNYYGKPAGKLLSPWEAMQQRVAQHNAQAGAKQQVQLDLVDCYDLLWGGRGGQWNRMQGHSLKQPPAWACLARCAHTHIATLAAPALAMDHPPLTHAVTMLEIVIGACNNADVCVFFVGTSMADVQDQRQALPN